jgi:outer membrane receptor for ferric coprogen and ferric-rhodotorulic acid
MPTPTRFACAALALACAGPHPSAAQSAPPTPVTAPPAEPAVVLSPFTVDATADKGYLATQTLNGTRLRTELKDVGSALTIFTEQLMDDLAATSLNDLAAFSPNTDPFIAATGDVTGNGNDFINVGNQQFVTRGGATAIVSQDFFGTNVPNDRFNSENLTFTRGPNAILFGLGNASGAFVSSSKRARFRDATTVAYQGDHRGSYRATLDHNQVVKPGLLAVRYSGLLESRNTFRPPTEDLQRRHYATLTFTPFQHTSLRVNYEAGDVNSPAVRPWPDYDAVTPWLAAGSPIVRTFTNIVGGKPAGTVNYANAGLVSTQFSRGGVPIRTQNLNNTAQSARPSFPNFPVHGASFRSLVDDSIYPTFATNFGSTAFRLHDYRTVSIFLEQHLARDLFVEVAYNRLRNRLIALNGVVGQNDYLYIDPNAQLPDGSPNPNVGKLYTEGVPTRIDAPGTTENVRVTASYTLDFARWQSQSRWLRHLGRHQAAVFTEESQSRSWSSNNALRNLTPFATTGAAANIGNAANQLAFRYYLEPERGRIGTAAGAEYLKFPVLYAGDAPPPGAGTDLVTPGFYAQQGLNMSAGIVKTRALATQSFFWRNRIVVTHGLRTDDNTSWRGTPNDFTALRDANGFSPRGDGIDLRRYLPGSRRERGGRTFTRGVVVHATDWLSLTWNTSNNFQVNDARLNVYGDLLPNPEGEGSDYGVKVSLFRGRVFAELTRYTNSNLNAVDAISNNAAGDFKTPLDRLWIAIAGITGDAKYDTYPYNALGTTWQDAVSTTSKGWEFSVTANPTERWRVTVNGSKRGDNSTTERGPFITAYLAQHLPFIKSHPEWQAANVVPLNLSVAQVAAQLESTLENFRKIRSSPSANFASQWTLNLVQSYNLAGALRGFSLGGSMNARGKSVGGFAVDANNLLDVTRPYYTPAYATFGAWASYRRKIIQNRIDWRLQLNVRNVFDRHTIYPLFIVDRRDGQHSPETAVFTLREPRTWVFTSTFAF